MLASTTLKRVPVTNYKYRVPFSSPYLYQEGRNVGAYTGVDSKGKDVRYHLLLNAE